MLHCLLYKNECYPFNGILLMNFIRKVKEQTAAVPLHFLLLILLVFFLRFETSGISVKRVSRKEYKEHRISKLVAIT